MACSSTPLTDKGNQMKEYCLATKQQNKQAQIDKCVHQLHELISPVLLDIGIFYYDNCQSIRLMHTIRFTSLLKAKELSFYSV
jgi:hypothetical protein